MERQSPDRVRQYLTLLTTTLDKKLGAEDAARALYLSRFYLNRLVQAVVRERPSSLRRRILLERAAWDLTHSERTVMDIALAAGYETASSFARAFRTEYGHSPKSHRLHGGAHHLPATNGIHFHPPAALWAGGDRKGGDSMDLVDRMLDQDDDVTRVLLRQATALSDDVLDAPLDLGAGNQPEVTAESLRGLLERMVHTKEMWSASILGVNEPTATSSTVPELLRRWDAASGQWGRVVRDVRDGERWNDAFIDLSCDPPETFVLGAAILHVFTHTAYRRGLAIGVMRRLGTPALNGTDPIDWERQASGRDAAEPNDEGGGPGARPGLPPEGGVS
jgi:AraC-like DNA-binding protein/uncharacterized damage-inducible protein DinB